MKILVLAVLLIAVCCCQAMHEGSKSTGPIKCCFRFRQQEFPSNRVATITETHHTCSQKGFIVKTIRGKQICVRHDAGWAVELFHQKNAEGSGKAN